MVTRAKTRVALLGAGKIILEAFDVGVTGDRNQDKIDGRRLNLVEYVHLSERVKTYSIVQCTTVVLQAFVLAFWSYLQRVFKRM